MAKVNPPPTLRIPRAFVADREVRAFIEQQNTILFQLYNRTGGEADAIEGSQQDIISSSSRVSRNAAKINSLELKDFILLETLVDVTTEGNQIIACYNTANITVTLDPQAIEEDEVHIKRRGYGVNVVGLIDGLTNRFINIPNYSMHLFFTGTEWIEI